MNANADRTRAKQEARTKRETELAAAIRTAHTPSSPTAKFGIILADPPWRFEPYSRNTGMDRAADNHYPTMALAKLHTLAIPAADDAILFLWRTAPMLMEAIATMMAWGFVYKSELVWTKDKAGTGYWFRNQHEALILATRGHPVAPAPGTQSSSWLHAHATGHSVKPANVHHMIEDLWPHTPKVEFFARERRAGWEYRYSPELETQ